MGILGRLKSGSFNESKFENGKQSIKQPRACVPHTPYALVLKFCVIYK